MKWMTNRGYALLLGLVTLSLLAGCNLIEKQRPPEVELVWSSYVPKFQQETIGAAFDSYLGDSKWELVAGAKKDKYVRVTGKMTYQEKPVTAEVLFRVYPSEKSFEFDSLSFNEIEQPDIVATAVITDVFEKVNTTNSQIYEEVKRNLRMLMICETAYYDEYGTYTPDLVRLAFEPEQEIVHCQYAVSLGTVSVGTRDQEYTVVAACDPGDGGPPEHWAAVYAQPGLTRGVDGPWGKCSGDGVWSRAGKFLGAGVINTGYAPFGLCTEPNAG
jgi:hypothetical protein